MSLSSQVALAKNLGTVIKKEGESIHMLFIFKEMLALSPFNVGYRVVVCIFYYKCVRHYSLVPSIPKVFIMLIVKGC